MSYTNGGPPTGENTVASPPKRRLRAGLRAYSVNSRGAVFSSCRARPRGMCTRSPSTSAPAPRHRRRDSGSRRNSMPISCRIVSAFASMISTASVLSSSTAGSLRRMYGYLAAWVRARARRTSRPRRGTAKVSVTASLALAVRYARGARRRRCAHYALADAAVQPLLNECTIRAATPLVALGPGGIAPGTLRYAWLGIVFRCVRRGPTRAR